MVSVRDRALVEAKAAGLDVESMLEEAVATDAPARRHPRRPRDPHVPHHLFHHTAVGFNVVYFQTVFNFTAAKANSVGNWWWAFNALALAYRKESSDKVRGAQAVHGLRVRGRDRDVDHLPRLRDSPSHHQGLHPRVTVTVLAAFTPALRYACWTAVFTETVERRNPAHRHRPRSAGDGSSGGRRHLDPDPPNSDHFCDATRRARRARGRRPRRSRRPIR